MFVIIIISIISLIFAWMYSIGRMKEGLKISFILLAFISCIRHDIGNDYWAYYNQFEYTITNYTLLDCISELFSDNEMGWRILIILFSPIGWHGFIAFISLFVLFSYYRLINKYVAKKYTWIAVFIYLFSPMFFLLSLSMIRQSFAMSIFLYSIPLLEKKKYIKLLILYSIAYSIHQSSIILFPLIIICSLPLNKGKFYSIILPIVFITFFFSSSLLENIYSSIVLSNDSLEHFDNYSLSSGYGNKISYGIGTILSLIPFSIVLIFLRNNAISREDRLKALIFSLATIIIPFHSIVPLISRLSLYFSSLSIIIIPLSYDKVIKNTQIKNLLLFVYMFNCIYDYIVFFSPSSVYYKPYLEYHSIFTLL